MLLVTEPAHDCYMDLQLCGAYLQSSLCYGLGILGMLRVYKVVYTNCDSSIAVNTLPTPPNKSHNKTKHEPKCIAEPCSSICDVQKCVLIITHTVKHHFYLKAHYNPNPHYVPVSITILMCATMPSLIPISVTQGGGSYHWSDEDDMHKALT